MSKQSDFEHIKDLHNLGKITTEQANVMFVKFERVKIIYKLPRDVRIALNNAVKNKELAHMPKKDFMPEVYYHPDFKHLANELRNKEQCKKLNNLKSVLERGM